MRFSADRYSGLARFRYALRSFLAASEHICRQAGITATQYQAILALGCSGQPISIKLLAEQLFLKHHSAVQLVDRLCAAKLVQRTASEGDARVALVKLTAKGQGELAALAKLHLAEVLQHEPKLTGALQLVRLHSDEI
jgi:DNA-binding MarR family transcriptional regulator